MTLYCRLLFSCQLTLSPRDICERECVCVVQPHVEIGVLYFRNGFWATPWPPKRVG